MDLLQKGQKISINIYKQDKLVEMLGKINDIFDDRLEVELPPYFMRYVECLDVGSHLTVKVFSKFGTIDFNTVVITSPLEDNFCIELDYNAMKFIPGEDMPVVDAIEKLNIIRNNEVISAKTLELSTEYIKLYSGTDLEIDDNFDCELILPDDYGIIKFKATVIYKDTIYDNEYKVSYYSMSEDDRQTLLYYMYVYIKNYDQEQS